MKTQLTSLAIIASTMPFAFWELEGYAATRISHAAFKPKSGPFEAYYKVKPIKSIKEISYDLDDSRSKNIYFFLYNKQTNYSITCYLDPELITQTIEDRILDLFIKPEKQLSAQLGNFPFYFTVEKESLNFQQDPLTLHQYLLDLNDKTKFYLFHNNNNKLHQTIMLNKRILHPFNIPLQLQNNKKIKEILNDMQKKYNPQLFQIQSTFATPSEVIVHNIAEGNVEIKMEGKQSLDFQTVLTHYFDAHQKYINFSEKLNHSPTSKTLELLRPIPEINKIALQRLQNCKILEVYTVRQNKKGQNSIIWGSAQENKEVEGEKRRFHWITELDHDIADVLKEYYAQYVKSS